MITRDQLKTGGKYTSGNILREVLKIGELSVFYKWKEMCGYEYGEKSLAIPEFLDVNNVYKKGSNDTTKKRNVRKTKS